MAKKIIPLIASTLAVVGAVDPTLKIKTFVDVMPLKWDFDPVKASYWTGLLHHRRTPFAVSRDGNTGYIAYLDPNGTGVHVQHIEPSTMNIKGPDVTIENVYEAGGIVAYNHGFALLGNEPIPSTTSNAPPSGTDYPQGTPVPAIYQIINDV
ncbi:hypothetical protein LTR78_005896 [Recurvomyces mirabilis]|uniref:Uncharacterized protein n=1 Tax=Recurvomyces mirabilis TaxID=574656 RepID=A0AAE1C0R6_9PEZI|nr:hypothetical protein LTR78_005896 [Recurvomyces mirabilis]KAK5155295.1 hypothetical protein LTS14_006250 [Recurvomyces mirabilis]